MFISNMVVCSPCQSREQWTDWQALGQFVVLGHHVVAEILSTIFLICRLVIPNGFLRLAPQFHGQILSASNAMRMKQSSGTVVLNADTDLNREIEIQRQVHMYTIMTYTAKCLP